MKHIGLPKQGTAALDAAAERDHKLGSSAPQCTAHSSLQRRNVFRETKKFVFRNISKILCTTAPAHIKALCTMSAIEPLGLFMHAAIPPACMSKLVRWIQSTTYSGCKEQYHWATNLSVAGLKL
jgi:hypothetical protein